MIESDELMLRRMVWLKHGCSIHRLYGDDGEMQCNTCMIDFKRDSVSSIEKKVYDIDLSTAKKIMEELKKENKSIWEKNNT